MDIAEFDYDLPAASIAQRPLEDRSSSRLLVVDADDHHRHVRDFPGLVGPGDVVVVNDTKVLPARLGLFKPTGGAVEVLLLAPSEGGAWEALVRPSRRVPSGTVLVDADGGEVLRVEDDHGEGRRTLRSIDGTDMVDVADRYGTMPLPPYITEALGDADRYQTVYAQNPGSVAAPTAGLHFTNELLAEVAAAGAKVVSVELRVGLGTFRPITVDDVSTHAMHGEWYRVPPETQRAVDGAERVIAIGTTSVRALESAASTGEPSGSTELFIYPGYDWKVVDALLTNFHLPRSSLLVMLAAFMGPGWKDVYGDAVASDYRFLSFGDAMFVERSELP